MMEGLGFKRDDFADETSLHPAAAAYKRELREWAAAGPWQAAAALLTIFVEGSVNERAELAARTCARAEKKRWRGTRWSSHYGCPPSAMDLTRAHAEVEGGHRADAWKRSFSHVETTGPSPALWATGASERWRRGSPIGTASRSGWGLAATLPS